MKADLGLPRPRRLQARRVTAEPTLAPDQLRTAWQLISLALEYPDEPFMAALPELRAAAAGLPEPVAAPLERLFAVMAERRLLDLQADFVAIFDTTRKCALHLTYYSSGETRKRGIALVQFKQAYRKAGVEVTDAELPDHLAVVLEFGARTDQATCWKLLNDHRAGIEILQLGLTDRDSIWAEAITALRATLPELSGDQREVVAQLLAEGPPDEDVGLDGYALDPQLNPHPDELDLMEGAAR